MPELNFCFRLNWIEIDQFLNATEQLHEIDHVHENLITGSILDKASMQNRADTVFSSIRYLSKNGWIELNLTGMPTDKPRFKWHGVTFERFYFLQKKCISINTNQIHHRKTVYFNDTFDGTYQVIHVNFNRSFLEKNPLIVFYTRTSKRYVSELKYLNYTSPLPESEKSKISYTLLQEQFGGFWNLKISLFYRSFPSIPKKSLITTNFDWPRIRCFTVPVRIIVDLLIVVTNILMYCFS